MWQYKGPTASGSLAAERRRDGHFPRLAAQAKDQGLQVETGAVWERQGRLPQGRP